MFDVELIDVGKTYGKVAVIDSLSLNVKPGEFLFLLGPSGCGKTTTLRVIAGLEQPTQGAVKIAGKTVNGVPTYKRNTAMVFQNWCLFPHKTVYDNVAFGLRMRRLSRSNLDERVRQVMALVELSGYERRMPGQLSGGEQQRVALARALVVEPAVLLLDEPFSNLDHRLRQQMRLELSQIQKQLAVTTVFVTHDPLEALSMADRVAIMRNGRIEQVGSPTEVYERPNTEFVASFTGEINLFVGEVRDLRERETLVVTKDCLALKLPKEERLLPGCRVSVSVRPQAIQFLNGNGASMANAFEGVVTHKAYLGDHMRYYIRLSQGVTVFADRDLDGREPYAIDAQVRVGWPADHCLYFPKG